MNSVEMLLKFDYNDLKQFILKREPFMLEVLKDIRIKEKLINSNSKYDLIWLVQEMPDEYAYHLFDDEGIKILSQTSDVLDKMNGILTCGKKFINKLFEKPEFCKIVTNNFERLKSYLYGLDEKGALNFIKYIQENEPDKLKSTLVNLSKDVQEKVVKEIKLPTDVLIFCVIALQPKASEYLVNNDIRITSLKDYSFDELHTVFSKEFRLKPTLLEDRTFIKKIVSMSDVKDYRFLINELAKANNVVDIERLRKDYYTAEMISYNPEFKMLEKHCQCYKEICKLIDSDDIDSSKVDEIMSKCFNFFGSGQNKLTIGKKIWDYIATKDKEGLREFFVEESNIQMSNIIIDYHFEDVPYNFFLDIKQLCKFQENEGRTLSDEDLNIYTLLSNIDLLSYEEKMILHRRLIKEDWISKHYDVFRKAKDKAATLIKDKMLSSETIQEYYNKELSDENGVPIYVLDGQDFFALVKSLNYRKSFPLEKSHMVFNVDGSSFSLDGSNKLDTYRDPQTYYNLIYSDFPIDQVVHMYTVDSYSRYDRNSGEKATPRVYELLTPQEFVDKSSGYNEIVIAQPNRRNANNELNANLKMPTLLGIYCYDELTIADIESARNLNVGIVVVKTKSYDVKEADRLTLADTLTTSFDKGNPQNSSYLMNVSSGDMENRRTK